MATGACGINCSVCRLNLLGICSTCGSGKSTEGLRKMAAQERILGAPCPILACAIESNIEYCLRDCSKFPCHAFERSSYPFGMEYLKMQKRRRNNPPPSLSPLGDQVTIPDEYWENLKAQDMGNLCERTLARSQATGSLIIPFLNRAILLNVLERRAYLQNQELWQPLDHPLIVLLVLVYCMNAKPLPLEGEMVSAQQLKTGHFFQGPHELKTGSILERYGNDMPGFKEAAEKLGGESLDMADISYKFRVFPRIPLYYLMWRGDEEFPPSLSILFDRSIEAHLAADAIWGMVNLISDLLLMGKGLKAFDNNL